ncbi:MAG: acyl-CoA dehydratase activase-related protein [Actinobacteria bacterium]|nr:acyl-CoA dehydratase activase-related protein [Actinomycetota bacterium]
MHVDKFPELTYESLKELSKILNIKYKDVIYAFENALKAYAENQKELLNTNSFNAFKSDNKLALTVLGHPYMIYDNYLSMRLVKKLMDRDITVYTPANVDYETKRQNAYPFQGKVFWDDGFENLGSAFTFAEDKNIKGIIYLTPFACGVDSFILEFIERRLKSHYNLPLLKLTIDEHTGDAGFDTRLEAFLDMLG